MNQKKSIFGNSEERDLEIVDLILDLASQYEVAPIMRMVVERCPPLVGARTASLYWMDYANNHLYLRETHADNRRNIRLYTYEIGEGLTGWVAKHGRPLLLRDITDEDERAAIAPDLQWADKYKGYRNSSTQDALKSFLAVPVLADDQTVGVLRVSRIIPGKKCFSEKDKRLLLSIARRLGKVIIKAEQLARVQAVDSLVDLDLVRDYQSLDRYLYWLAQQIPRQMNARACSVFLRDDSNNFVLRAATEGTDIINKVGLAKYQIGSGLTGFVAMTGKTVRVASLRNEDELRAIDQKLIWSGGQHNEFDGEEHANFLSAAIKIGGDILGVVRIIRVSSDLPFTRNDERVMERLCQSLAFLLQTVHLRTRGSMVVYPRYKARPPKNRQLAFILMPYSENWSKNVDGAICRACISTHFVPQKAKTGRNGFIMEDIWNGVTSAEVLIADITGGNPNVAYEVGLADVIGTPLLLMAQDPKTIPFDFSARRVIVYDPLCLGKLEKELIELLQELKIDRTAT